MKVVLFRRCDYTPAKSTLTATIAVQEDAAGVISALLSQFPKGSRVRLALSQEDESENRLTNAEEYRQRVAAARREAPPSPWKSTAEAMKTLREGEDA